MKNYALFALLILTIMIYIGDIHANCKHLYISISYRDSLQLNLEQSKKLKSDFAAQLKIVRSYYPELDNTYIECVRKNISTTMAARPNIAKLLTNPTNRKYIIYIDNKVNGANGLLYDSLSFDAQIGIIGHELAHILDYINKNSFGLLLKGFKYSFSKAYKKHMERSTDLVTIQHGLGLPLYKFAAFVQNSSQVSTAYKKFKRHYYMSPNEILDYLKRLNTNKLGGHNSNPKN